MNIRTPVFQMPIMRFEIVKKGWWRPRFTILSDVSVVGGIGEDTIRAESGTIEVGGIDYKIIGRGFFDKAYELHGEDLLICAWKPFSIFRNKTTVEHNCRRYALTQVSTLNWYMLMHENENLVGTIRKAGFFSRRSVAELPMDLSLQAQVFIIWLALAHRRQESNNNG